MTADKPSFLVPRLRFPEFDGSSEWNPQRLDEVSSSIFDGTHQTPTYTEEGVPFYSVENLISGTANKFISRDDYLEATRKNKPEKGDILLTRIGKIGHSKAVTWDHEFSVYVTLAVIKASPGFDTSYLAYYLQSGCYQTELIRKSLQSAVPPKINLDSLRSTLVLLPDMEEQVKIADCLGSLDDLIVAVGRKLETYREYKQGLMQHLFPQPGETVPRLRFPEFRNAADWKTKILGTQGSFLSSLTGKAAKDFDTGDAAFIPYMNVFSNPFTNTTDLRSVNVADDESQSAVTKGDVFFTVSSETPEEAGMSSVLLEEIGNCYLNSFCALFRFDEGKSPDPVFLGYLLRSAPAREHLSRGAQGATRYNISRATFRSLPILIPSGPEQRKIADCLGPLDDLIGAEGRKLDSLRQHKRGLIQQLFPSLAGH